MIAMTNQIFKLAGVVFTCAVIAACSADVENPPPLNSGEASAGDADFTTFVAIGDSLTAGYKDGTLYLQGQLTSMPSILAEQFADVGGGTFTQPLVADPTDPNAIPGGNLGGLLNNGVEMDFGTGVNQFDTRFVLNTETQAPERIADPIVTDVVNVQAGPYNNMGVPGAKSFHLAATLYGDDSEIGSIANPWYVRMASATNASVLGDAVAQTPSFVTVWVGGNDVLLYAASGGWDDYLDVAASTSGFGSFDITELSSFASFYSNIIDQLTLNNAALQGVLINIPEITSIPYFTVVPYNAVPMTADEAAQANAGFSAYNDGLDAVVGLVPNFTQEEADRRKISFAEGQNPLVIMDKDLTDLTVANAQLISMRQATQADLIMFDTAAKLGTEAVPNDPTTFWGVGAPLLDQDVLIPSEREAVEAATAAYNQTIADIAAAEPNFVLYDAATALAELKESGINYGNGSVTADYASGGFFSLDGIHPTSRGYAIIANQIIDVINTGFKANVYKVDAANYPTVLLK
jgi:lysophospholipase L1-like esterase